MAETITVRQEQTPQDVTDALTALVSACKEWPTTQVVVDRSSPPKMPSEPRQVNEAEIACTVAMEGSDVIYDGMKDIAIWSAVAAVMVAFMLWLLYRFARSIPVIVRGLMAAYRDWKSERASV